MLIVFIGPDGCGKTTVANALVEHLSGNTNTSVRFFEMNFGLLPRFRDIAAALLRRPVGKNHSPGEFMGGMKSAPNSPIRGGVYTLWYSLDYFLGGLLHRKLLVDGVVIFARYAYDYGYQRSYARVPRFFHKFMLFVSPKADFVFTIDRNAEVIFKSKPELEVEEIRNQQEKISLMLIGKPYFYILDGNKGVEATVAQALSIIERARKS